METQLEAWLAMLRGGPGTELSTAAEGVTALEVCDAARRSSNEGCWVEVA